MRPKKNTGFITPTARSARVRDRVTPRLVDTLFPSPTPLPSTAPSSVTPPSDLPPDWKDALDAAASYRFPDPKELIDMPQDSWATMPADEETVHALAETFPPYTEDAPWQKMEDETPLAFSYFCEFRALGIAERSTGAVARKLDLSGSYISNLANKYDWHRRVQAWDDYRERVYTTQLLEETREMAHRHAETAQKGIAALSTAFEAIIRRVEEDEEAFIAELSEKDAARLLAVAKSSAQVLPNLMNAERLSRGLPTELSATVNVSETRVTIHTSDELAQLAFGLADVLAGNTGPGVIDVRRGKDIPGEEADATPE